MISFFGDNPYVMLPGIEVSKRLTYNPLLINPVTIAYPVFLDFLDNALPSIDYFIGIKSINVKRCSSAYE